MLGQRSVFRSSHLSSLSPQKNTQYPGRSEIVPNIRHSKKMSEAALPRISGRDGEITSSTPIESLIKEFHDRLQKPVMLETLHNHVQESFIQQRYSSEQVWNIYCRLYSDRKQRMVYYSSSSKNTETRKNRLKRKRSVSLEAVIGEGLIQHVVDKDALLHEHYCNLKQELASLEETKSKQEKKECRKKREKAKEILIDERSACIQNFFERPGKKVYVDSLNLCRNLNLIRIVRSLFPSTFPVCFVVRECVASELTIELLDQEKGIEYVFVPSSRTDDDFVLLELLEETDGLFLSDDLFQNISDETLAKAGLKISHVWIEKRRLEYCRMSGGNYRLVFQKLINEVGAEQ